MLDFDYDCVIWDVGYQVYFYKLIIGWFNDFDFLCQQYGVVGYFKCIESNFDYFGVGYVSIFILVVLGMVMVWDNWGELFKCVVVIGDGVLIGGMVFEVINYVGYFFNILFLVVLNDNDMLIFLLVGVFLNVLNCVWFSLLMQFFLGSVEESVWYLFFMGGEIFVEFN